MQKLSLSQSLQQKLSPQQIQFIKLLQIPTVELDARIEEELEINPALEEGMDEEYDQKQEDDSFDEADEYKERDDELDIDRYIQDEDYGGYKMQGDGNYAEEERDMPLATSSSLMDSLLQQFGYLTLTDQQRTVGLQLIGSIEADGYIRRSLQAIVNDLAFGQNVFTDTEEVEEMLHKIQSFDPAGYWCPHASGMPGSATKAKRYLRPLQRAGYSDHRRFLRRIFQKALRQNSASAWYQRQFAEKSD